MQRTVIYMLTIGRRPTGISYYDPKQARAAANDLGCTVMPMPAKARRRRFSRDLMAA